ncbi:MAG TPA: DUF1003 domain-containing protein [Spirochaetota bacterium]|nr:DUF1003 domain-containing protein [Spirochaetota bacterium]
MMHLNFPPHFKHDHEPVKNVNLLHDEQLTVSQRTADRIARIMGSWRFIIIQSILLSAWIVLNITAYIRHWDPYPFILMNLVLSMQAAYAAPIIMMSQNRQSEKDRIEAHNDYIINQKVEVEVGIVLEHLEAQNIALENILVLLNSGDGGRESGR